MSKVLVVDDNPSIGAAIEMLLDLHDIETVIALTPQAGLQAIIDDDVALVIQDMNFTEDTTSGDEGKQLFREIRRHDEDMPIILLTAWTMLETAVELVKSGAADYLSKPWDDERLVASVKNLIELHELQRKQLSAASNYYHARRKLEESANLCGLVFQSQSMLKLIEIALQVADSDVSVLITGPNGAGKEKVAEIIQKNSRLKDGPFVRVNVGALPNDLMEAELFGAEPGAYTGLTKKRIGRFEAADGGTLFLDEMGNLSSSGQMKLLRVLQTGEFERLGSSETIRCDVRVITATNADLRQAIAEGKFREDLFYRLNVIELRLPSLAERPEDVLPLINHFLGKDHCVTPDAAKALQRYHWPGNVRELQNATQRAKLLSKSRELGIHDFGLEFGTPKTALKSLVIEPSRELILEALEQNQGIISQAARQLGFSRQALYRRMDKFDIPY